MKPIRIGIIGTGIIANRHAQMYAEIPGVEIVAACDLNEAKLNAYCDKYGITNRYQNFREMIQRDDLDSVDVCLHNNLHAPVSVEVLMAGKHCYCEKPMAGTYVDALAMKQTAELSGKRLHIQISTLYGAECRAAKRVVDSGYLGKIYHARSYGFRRRGRPFVDGYGEKEFNSRHWAEHGALFDVGVYHIAQLLYLMGLPKVERVFGQTYQELAMHEERRIEGGFDVEELGVGLVKFEGSLTLDIIESWAIHTGPFPYSSISGSQGGLRFTSGIPGAKYTSEETLELFNEIAGYPASTVLQLQPEEYRMHQLHPDYQLMDNSIRHWIGALRGQCELIDTPEIALQTMLVSEGIFKSGLTGGDMTAEQIIEESRSSALTRQDTPFGELVYNRHPFR